MAPNDGWLASLPMAIEPRYVAPKANVDHLLYKGDMRLGAEKDVLVGKGVIKLQWLPSPAIRFEMNGDLHEMPGPHSSNYMKERTLKLAGVHARDFVEVRQTDETFLSDMGLKSVAGVVDCWSRGSGGSIQRVAFYVPNLRSYLGGWVRNCEGRSWRGRTSFLHDQWKITIDEVATEELKRELKGTGGFAFTHVGWLEKADGASFSGNEATEQLEALTDLLSFYNGRWTEAMLPQQVGVPEQGAWRCWSPARVTANQYVNSWCDGLLDDPLGKLASGFFKKWSDETWSETIRHAIYWYVSANAPGASLEGAVVLSQIAFETIAWTTFVQSSPGMSEKEFKKLSGAERLRLLLEKCGIPDAIPEELEPLRCVAEKESWSDGPQAVTAFRNAYVHPSPKSRKRLAEDWEPAARDVWDLSMQYLELILLRLFEYSGKYCSRVSRDEWKGQDHRPVPWAVTLAQDDAKATV